jgi:hypothetical protein
MSTRQAAARAAHLGPNQAAHRLLAQLIERAGLSKRAFLDQLADLGYPFSDDDFANWGRAGRAFPRAPGALRAMVQVVTGQRPPERRCTADEALQFLGLTGMPFPELHAISALFDAAAFREALAAYLPVEPRAAPAHGGAFELERLPPEPDQGAVISKGLSALAELLWEPEAREAVARFRAEFEVACEQVGVLADYKWLHDLFQQLEDRYYLLYHDYRRLPADPSAWALIERNEPELQTIADELLERGASATVAADAAGWRQKLARVRRELRASVEGSDVERLARAMTLLKDVLGRELSRINTRLVGTASTLRLRALIAALAVVHNTLSRRNLGPATQPRFAAFEDGLAALARLNERMARVIDTHNAFQEVDDELRRSEALLEHDASELRYAWQSLRPMLRRLCDASTATWETKLTSLGAELDAALDAENTPRAVRLFRACRSQASRSFNQVDRALLGICEELRQIGEPLATVLKMIV